MMIIKKVLSTLHFFSILISHNAISVSASGPKVTVLPDNLDKGGTMKGGNNLMNIINKLYGRVVVPHLHLVTTDGERIVNGNEVNPPRRYEYMVSLQLQGSGHFCGGMLINSGWVLSAAHCQGVATHVHIGRHNIKDNSEDYEVFEVGLEIPHPDFSESTFENDVMLIKFFGESSFQPVRLDDGSDSSLTEDRADVTAIGWGALFFSGGMPCTLREVVVDVVGNDECSSPIRYGDKIKDSMMCAARFLKDSCQGDSGGPLIHRGDDAASDILVGIVSWGFGCAFPTKPGVYSRVSYLYDWIQENQVTPSPTVSNVPTTQPTPCPSDGFGVTVEVKTDQYPDETSWSLKQNGAFLDFVTAGTYDDRNTVYNHFSCSKTSDACLEFTINDSYGDGICCSFGNGYYKIYKDSELIKSGSGSFGSSESSTLC